MAGAIENKAISAEVEAENFLQVIAFYSWRKLRPVPQNNTLFGGTVPPNNTLFDGTVPPNCTLFGGTL